MQACHRAYLAVACDLGAREIAFSAVGTGAFGWPPRTAADVALEAVAEWLEDGASVPGTITFVCADAVMAPVYGEQVRNRPAKTGLETTRDTERIRLSPKICQAPITITGGSSA